MINIDFLTLNAFLIENIKFLIGARLQKIQQPTRRDLILSIRNNGESRKLYINIFPQYYHIAFMSDINEKRRRLVIPTKPPMFCMLLRKHIEGAKIIDAQVLKNERILELYLESYDELSQQRKLCLCIELMGKYSNIILYDKKTKTIIGCAHNVGPEKSKYRELQGGLTYIYPPASDIRLSNELSKQFRNLNEQEIKKYLEATSFNPAIKDDRYTLFAELIDNSIAQESVNTMLDNYYTNFQEKIHLEQEKTKLIEVNNTKLKKVNNSVSKISELLKKRNDAEKYKLYGELLTANLYQNFDFQTSVTVYDYINNTNIDIKLDNKKTLKENAQQYYKLYNKAKTTKEKSENLIKSLSMEKSYLENIIYSIENSNCVEELDEIKYEMGIIEPKKVKKQDNITKICINNFDIYIGKNNKQNDYIISKLAKDNDYWFHTRNCAGSHVLLKINGTEPDENVIFECCKLARKYSSSKQPSKVGIIYTKAKYLKKPPGAPLGYVTYKNEKEILI